MSNSKTIIDIDCEAIHDKIYRMEREKTLLEDFMSATLRLPLSFWEGQRIKRVVFQSMIDHEDDDLYPVITFEEEVYDHGMSIKFYSWDLKVNHFTTADVERYFRRMRRDFVRDEGL